MCVLGCFYAGGTKNNTDLVSSVTSQEFVLSLCAGVRFALDTWTARRLSEVIKGF